jgi:hypothetical protein
MPLEPVTRRRPVTGAVLRARVLGPTPVDVAEVPRLARSDRLAATCARNPAGRYLEPPPRP